MELKEMLRNARTEVFAGKKDIRDYFFLIENYELTYYEVNKYLDENDSKFNKKIESRVESLRKNGTIYFNIKENMEAEESLLWFETKKKFSEWNTIYDSTIKGAMTSKEAFYKLCAALNEIIDKSVNSKTSYELYRAYKQKNKSIKELISEINIYWFRLQKINSIINKLEKLFDEKIVINKKTKKLVVKK